jgi:hypothetical protein
MPDDQPKGLKFTGEISKMTPEEQLNELNLMLRQAKDFVYVNASYLSGSNWDVRILFCERLPSDDVQLRVAIVMSHQQAKALSLALSQQVDKLESVLGEIHWQPADTSSESTRD